MNRVQFFSLLSLCICSPLSTRVIKIKNEQEFNSQIKQSAHPTLIKFSTPWCATCGKIEQSFQDVSDEQEFDNILFAHVDADELKTISKQHGVIGVPAFVYLENGSTKNQTIGIHNTATFKDDLRSTIRKSLTLAHGSAMQQEQEQEQEQELHTIHEQHNPQEKKVSMSEKHTSQPSYFEAIQNNVKHFLNMLIQKMHEIFNKIKIIFIKNHNN